LFGGLAAPKSYSETTLPVLSLNQTVVRPQCCYAVRNNSDCVIFDPVRMLL
jgi:hypothetical protein